MPHICPVPHICAVFADVGYRLPPPGAPYLRGFRRCGLSFYPRPVPHICTVFADVGYRFTPTVENFVKTLSATASPQLLHSSPNINFPKVSHCPHPTCHTRNRDQIFKGHAQCMAFSFQATLSKTVILKEVKDLWIWFAVALPLLLLSLFTTVRRLDLGLTSD